MTLRVRPMQSGDVDSVYAIELAAHRAPWSRDILRDCVLVNYDCRMLEIDNGFTVDTVGYVICRYDETVCHVLNLCIKPALQGKSYGQFLLQNVIDSLPDTVINMMVLEVRPSNLPALHLYQKMGFQEIGVKRGYYRDDQGNEDAVVLQRYILHHQG